MCSEIDGSVLAQIKIENMLGFAQYFDIFHGIFELRFCVDRLFHVISKGIGLNFLTRSFLSSSLLNFFSISSFLVSYYSHTKPCRGLERVAIEVDYSTAVVILRLKLIAAKRTAL